MKRNHTKDVFMVPPALKSQPLQLDLSRIFLKFEYFHLLNFREPDDTKICLCVLRLAVTKYRDRAKDRAIEPLYTKALPC